MFSADFVIPSDDIHMLRIVGTEHGRVLMCGKDGQVYELEYFAQEGWFRKKCRSHTT